MAFSGSTVALPLVQDGKLRALAVTSLQRSPAAPDLPTMAESGFPGFDATPWFGLMAPAATPAAIIERLHHEAVKVLALPGLRGKFEELGMQLIGSSPGQFASAIRVGGSLLGEGDRGRADKAHRVIRNLCPLDVKTLILDVILCFAFAAAHESEAGT
jgi:tripartite-type tricarboxylate transporter receptor subunit TctC